MSSRLFLFILFPFSCFSFSSTLQSNEEGKAFALEMNTNVVNTSASNTDPYDVPGYAGSDIPEAGFYSSGVGLQGQAQSAALSDPNAQYITEAKDMRPQYDIDPNQDALFHRHSEIKEKAHLLSDTYTGCVDLPVGNDDITLYNEESCTVTGHQDSETFNCTKNLDVYCSNADAGQLELFALEDMTVTGDAKSMNGLIFSKPDDVTFRIRTPNDVRTGKCANFENYIKFNIDDVNLVSSFVMTTTSYDDWLWVFVNGQIAISAVGGTMVTGFGANHLQGNYKCEKKGHSKTPNIDLRPALKNGENTIHIFNKVSGGGEIDLRFVASKFVGCDSYEEESWSCPVGVSTADASLDSSICIGGSETRNIHGSMITKSCWSWDEQYTKLFPPHYVKEPFCNELESQGCGQVGSSCDFHNGVFCESQTSIYSCPTEAPARTVSMCGSQLVCPDGECTSDVGQEPEDATEDFKEAATGMAVADEIAKGLDSESMTVFNGEALSCSKAALGFSNCCKDSGWGNGLGLSMCSSSELKLGMAIGANQVHKVGDYCSEDTLLGCVSRKHVYCSYPSKLARIIVEQGNEQFGTSYGTAKSPSCGGFSMEQVELLDFDSMDLSEYYSDVMANAANGSTPDSNTVVDDIKDKMSDRFPELDLGDEQ